MNKFLSGALAGLGATTPMTIVMLLLHEQLPWTEKRSLPPEEITHKLLARAGMHHKLNGSQHRGAIWLAHFGFGAAAGTLYGPLATNVKAPPALKGVLFGLLVWGISYLGWLPGMGLLNQPKDQPARPNWLMIVAHLVWGVSLGFLAEFGTDE